MTEKKRLSDTVAKQLLNTLPPSLEQLKGDIEKHVKTGLQNIFAKLELVTREEFDVQTAVLKRTREKLEALEAAMAKLESSDTQTH